jgi:ornithine carbamoyltransferase
MQHERFLMRHLLRLNDWTIADLQALFERADQYRAGDGPMFSGCAALFFPPSSLRTRLSFERGAALMGLQPVTFPPEALDTGEDLAISPVTLQSGQTSLSLAIRTFRCWSGWPPLV